MNKIRKGDDVIVIAGKDKGKRGAVLRRYEDDRVLVEGMNKVKRHTRPNPVKGQPGGILEKEMPMHASKVAIWNPGSSKADRIGVKALGDGKRGLYEPIHGSAPDIAGRGIANPIGTILSAALLLEHSLGWTAAARALEQAVADAVTNGARTADIVSPGKTPLSTRQMGDAVLAELTR